MFTNEIIKISAVNREFHTYLFAIIANGICYTRNNSLLALHFQGIYETVFTVVPTGSL